MPPNSPESPSKKAKQPINGLKRDQPLFASRRPRSLQQPPDFLTDSLNATYIPSPSPPRSPTRQDVRAKTRQILGKGPRFAAIKAAPLVNDENRPPSSSSSSERRNTQYIFKPRPAQGSIPARRPSPSKPTESPTRVKTPSPSRGRSVSITSPSNSESSPPRGYAEAYQRIVEEENLAQEESTEDMEELSGYEFNEQDRLQDLDRLRMQRIQLSTSPVSLHASRRASPHVPVVGLATKDEMDNKENNGHDSDSESAVSYMENITDTSVGSGSSQHAKDLQRLQGALKSGTKAFSKARLGERVGLSVENLQRQNGSTESLGSAFSSGSLSNKGSDPSINVPKTWGRKSKPSKDWLNRINSRSGRFTGDVSKRHPSGDQIVTENQKAEREESVDDGIATAAVIPLPSVDGSSRAGLSTQDSTPRNAVQRSSSQDRRRHWEVNEDDFTGRSLQASNSPPIRIRDATLDRIREREIESLEKRAVTTSRLGELREKSSGESLRRMSASRSNEEVQTKTELNSSESLAARQSTVEPTPRVESNDQNDTPDDTQEDEGEAIPDTPVVIYRSQSTGHVHPSESNTRRPELVREKPRRPSHERKDSHDLLKRLARATSESPTPTKETLGISPSVLPEAGKEVQHTPQSSRSTPDLKTPVVTGAWIDQTMEETSHALAANVDLKTPLITGAWIDTPLPTGGRGPPMPTPSDVEDQKELGSGKLGATDLIRRLDPNTMSTRPALQVREPLKYSGPPLPKSALAEIINDARSSKDDKTPKPASPKSDSSEDPTLHLGDSTIQSLEELISNDEDFSTLLTPSPQSPEETSTPTSDPSPASLSLTTSSRITDPQSYTHLLSRLSNLAPSIRASKKQLASLERTISNPQPRPPQTQPQSMVCNEAGEFHDFIWPCARCGCPGRPISPSSTPTTTITIPLPRLWRWDHNSRRPHLTWLGILTLIAWVLVLAEMWARARFCHPLFARSMRGYGVDIHAPRPPFVLAKVVYRTMGLGGVVRVSRILLRAVGALLGWVGGLRGNGAGGGETRGGREWGDGVRMGADEYL